MSASVPECMDTLRYMYVVNIVQYLFPFFGPKNPNLQVSPLDGNVCAAQKFEQRKPVVIRPAKKAVMAPGPEPYEAKSGWAENNNLELLGSTDLKGGIGRMESPNWQYFSPLINIRYI